jgi:hypothetical protein
MPIDQDASTLSPQDLESLEAGTAPEYYAENIANQENLTAADRKRILELLAAYIRTLQV